METQNDYDREVFNGDLGMVDRIDEEEGALVVNFEGREVIYPFGELDTLVPAFATTIHKSQGSEYPAVVIPVTTQHYTMLARNLVYTGVTRGKRLVVSSGRRRRSGSRSGVGNEAALDEAAGVVVVGWPAAFQLSGLNIRRSDVPPGLSLLRLIRSLLPTILPCTNNPLEFTLLNALLSNPSEPSSDCARNHLFLERGQGWLSLSGSSSSSLHHRHHPSHRTAREPSQLS